MKIWMQLLILLVCAFGVSATRYQPLLGPQAKQSTSNSESCGGCSIIASKVGAANTGADMRAAGSWMDQDPTCCEGAETVPMPFQARCREKGSFELPCYVFRIPPTSTDDHYVEFRERKKHKCPNGINYISCGPWVHIDNDCCSTPSETPSCTGNSGLPVCIEETEN